ncbi:phosphate acyltransferase PlsX [Endozoicomonas lisbonensis]|uniref:Phosphate acyltransferase n=1 Tax=Endozoicomonas lisbonensis TaxID=3120522 RepID=A0ABV2SM00_9GAMM
MRVALDIMSGDESPRSRIRAALRALNKYDYLELLLVGDNDLLQSYLNDVGYYDRGRLSLIHADATVAMDDKPSLALRTKRHSSMWQTLECVSDGRADACVSAGNTGALMAMGRFVLKTFAGVDRPAIAASVPSRNGSTLLLDVGANVDCTSMQLFQFAIMGSQLANAAHGIDRPRIGLLNVGTEEIKGNERVRIAHQLLNEHKQLNYIGYIEGHDIFSDRVDVVVCDGFAGNIALKTGEGVASLIADTLTEIFSRNLVTQGLAVLLSPILKEFNRKVDPELHNGASLLGLQGTVIKSHGGADEKGFYRAICQAVREAGKEVPARLAADVEKMLL